MVMLSSTKAVLSLALYLADTIYFTICMIIQDGIDLVTQGLAKKVVLALLIGVDV
jgi:hypothetical protein